MQHESNTRIWTSVQKILSKINQLRVISALKTPHSPRCCCTSLHNPLYPRKPLNPHICCRDKPAHKYLILSKNIPHNQTNPTKLHVECLLSEGFYLIWSTFGSFWHHVHVSGLIVIHSYFTVKAEQRVWRPFTCDGLSPSPAKYGSTLYIPRKEKSTN